MRACEGCRRRKIKCDAATTNTWPCSACIRLKLHCVRPNGFDGSSTDAQVYDPPRAQFDTSQAQDNFRQQAAMQDQQLLPGTTKPGASMYAPQPGFSDPSALYQTVHYPESASLPQNLHYTTVPPSAASVDHSFSSQTSFPTPPHQQQSPPESPPDAYNQDPCGQQDLAELLGSLKVDEAGTGQENPNPYFACGVTPLTSNCSAVLKQQDEAPGSGGRACI